MLIAPTIVEYLGSVMETKKVLATNTLNTYRKKDDELPIYIDDISKNNLFFDEYLNDMENVHFILMAVQNMIDNDIIKVSNEKVIRCNCGKVDLLKTAIRKFSDGKLYKRTDSGNLICASCNGVCREYEEQVLILNFDKDNYKEINIVPTFLSKEMKEFEKKFIGSKILVSKYRNTGYSVYKNDQKFFVDIDFLWMNFSKFLGQSNILIASNHQILKMFIMNYINNVSSEQDLTFLAHPYINKNDLLQFEKMYHICNDEYYKKLLILYNLNWRKKSCNYSESVGKYLSNISNTRRMNLYRAVLESSKDYILNFSGNNDVSINRMLTNSINLQKNIALSKKYVRK